MSGCKYRNESKEYKRMHVTFQEMKGCLFPWVFFLFVTFTVVLPWFLEPGFLFLLDFVWPPILENPLAYWDSGNISGLPHEVVWWGLSMILPTAFVQKIVFSLPFLLSGVTMFYLITWIIQSSQPLANGEKADHSTRRPFFDVTLPALTAGVLYALNPFVATSVFMGQQYFMLAYALMPWALRSFLIFVTTSTIRHGLFAGLAAAAVMLTNAHHVILLPLLLIASIQLKRPFRARIAPITLFLLPIGIFFVAALIAWGVIGTGDIIFDPRDPLARSILAPYSGNIFIDVLALTATWKTNLPFLFPYEVLPGFLFAFIAMFGAIGFALWYYRSRSIYSFICRRMVIVIIVGFVLAVGVSHPMTKPLSLWLYQNIPFWIGMRDSTKFVSILAFAESVILALGILAIQVSLRKRRRIQRLFSFVPVGFFLAILYLAWPAVYGYHGQVYPLQYPASWGDWKTRLAQHATPPSVVFLPWHKYLPFSFTGDRTVFNPAPRYFSNARVVISGAKEIGGTHGRPYIFSASVDPTARRIEQILLQQPTESNIAAKLADDNIRYVMLAKDTYDSTTYNYLYEQEDFIIVFDSPELIVFENRLAKGTP